MKIKTVTTAQPHCLEVGDFFTMDMPDTRWWRRAWFFVTFRELPLRRMKYKVTAVTSATSVRIRP